VPAENALAFLRTLDGPKPLANPILIAGPQAFLREYVLDAVARRLMRDGLKYRAFQIANAADSASVMEELRASDLFAPKRVMVCRVMRTYRERGGEVSDDGEESSGREARGADAGLADAIAQCAPPNHLVIVYDKDSAPAKVRRAAESAGMVINCLRPFDNQLPQYAQMFARGFRLKLPQSGAELLVSRHGGDLATIANALWKIAIRLEKGAAVEAADLAEQGSAKIPEAFEIAESLSAGKSGAAMTQLARALAGGRDVFEILAVEVIPVMRRMMVAATMLAARKRDSEIGAALGFGPMSPLATRAIDGARRFGLARLERVYQRASELDADLKNGQVKDREEALSALLLDLLAN
jgi:DNA polymerase III delta subunit